MPNTPEQLDTSLYYRISDLPNAAAITGDEMVEAVQDGKNVKFTLSDLMVAGKSAYDVAVSNGFTGTEIEWLSSLKGTSGQDGQNGLSALEVLKEAFPEEFQNYYLNDEENFARFLKGETGASGIDGKSALEILKTAFPEAFQNYYNTDEENMRLLLRGVDGRSAYELAIANGTISSDVSESDWLESLKGASAYDVAVAVGSISSEVSEEAWLETLKGADGKSAYAIAVENGFVGTEAEFTDGIMGKFSKGGGVFITAITPQNAAENVGEITYAVDDKSVVSCTSTTRNLVVQVLAITGYSKYRPIIKVNGVQVALTAKADAPLFDGIASITVGDDGRIVAEHDDGAVWEATVTMDAPPVIASAIFTDGYPSGQTELKAGDTFAVQVLTDVNVVGYEIANFGAFAAKSGTLSQGMNNKITGLVIADRGTATTAQGLRIRVKKANGAFSAWYNSTSAGLDDGKHTVKLNNTYPGIAFGAVTYPVDQTALKAAESATVNHMVTNYSSVQYSSTELTITQPTTYQAAKVVSRLSGGYNVAVKNFTVTATRSANAATTTDSIVVAIADALPTISVSTPATRLRSGGNAGTAVQKHTITITSNQALAAPPTINAPEGKWLGAGFVGNAAKTVWTRELEISDDNAKGVFSWNSMVAKSMSGNTQSVITGKSTYELGGFVFRTLVVDAYPNRSASIGTSVVDTTKLRCTNLSKAASGALNFAYQSTIVDTVNKYTITDIENQPVATGDYWYNADSGNAASNTSGTMLIEIEEVA